MTAPSPSFAGLRSAARRTRVPAVRFGRRRHETDHLLLWQVHGSSVVTTDGVARPLRGTFALWVPVGTTHEVHLHESSVLFPLLFDTAIPVAMPVRPVVLPVDASLEMPLLSVVQRQHTLLSSPVTLEHEVLALLAQTPPHRAEPPMPTSERALRVATALRLDPGDERDVAALARLVHTSPRTLERAFLAETGRTLRAWRTADRMEAAADLLREGADTRTAAARVGYASLSAFHRVFKRHFDRTPGAFSRSPDATDPNDHDRPTPPTHAARSDGRSVPSRARST